MNRRRFLALAGSAFAAAVLSPIAQPMTGTPEHHDLTMTSECPQTEKIYCGTSVNARGRFRHYLVNGQRTTERMLS